MSLYILILVCIKWNTQKESEVGIFYIREKKKNGIWLF